MAKGRTDRGSALAEGSNELSINCEIVGNQQLTTSSRFLVRWRPPARNIHISTKLLSRSFFVISSLVSLSPRHISPPSNVHPKRASASPSHWQQLKCLLRPTPSMRCAEAATGAPVSSRGKAGRHTDESSALCLSTDDGREQAGERSFEHSNADNDRRERGKKARPKNETCSFALPLAGRRAVAGRCY